MIAKRRERHHCERTSPLLSCVRFEGFDHRPDPNLISSPYSISAASESVKKS